MNRIAKLRQAVGVIVTLAILAASTATVAQQPGVMDLAAKMPNGANAVMVLNVENIRNSDIAKQNAWFLTSSGGIESGMNFVPVGTNLVLLAADMDYQTMNAKWNAALLTKDEVPTIAQIRETTDGRIDEILGVQVVETPEDFFIVPASETTVAAFQPALRQVFTNWLRRVQRGEDARIRDYLEKGLTYADEMGTEVVMVFNLENLVSRNRVAERARDSEMLRTAGISITDFSRMLASVQGVTVGISVKDAIRCQVKMEFTDDVSGLEPIAEQLIQEMMEFAGVYLEEFDAWEPVVDTNEIRIAGDLSVSSFRKIISLVDTPRANSVATTEEVNTRSSTDPAMLTKNHFDAVNSLVADLQPRLSVAQPLSTNSSWFRKYADKIDQLPTLNIDPLAVEFGNFVSQSLRDASLGLINTRENIKMGQQRLMASGSRSGGGSWGGWRSGGAGRRSGGDGSRLRRSARNSQRSGATMDITAMFTDIATVTRDIRQQLTDKYQIQF